LNIGLRLAWDLLRAPLPEAVLASVQRDRGAATLAASVRNWLAVTGDASPTLFDRAAFRLRMRGSWFFAPAYLLRLSFSPTEDDWQADGKVSHNGLLDALRRPFRLARKYGRSNKS
jgi:hypothetical protein